MEISFEDEEEDDLDISLAKSTQENALKAEEIVDAILEDLMNDMKNAMFPQRPDVVTLLHSP